LLAVWYVADGQIQSEIISEKNPGITRMLGTAVEHMRGGPASQISREATDSLLSRLQVLIPEHIKSQLSENARLVVYPSGPLYYFPLEAVVMNNRYLGDIVPIEYRHSVSVETARSGKDTLVFTGSSIGVFGGSFASTDNPRCKDENAGELARFRRLGPLDGVRREAQFITELFGNRASVFIDGPNQKQTFTQVSPRFDILHFCTHGVILDSTPDWSGLVLPITAGDTQDEIIRAAEIRNLKLRARLVVLSACRSGDGELIPGEGLQGLTQAFMLADAQLVVASLWTIRDLSAALFMKRLYQELLIGNDPVRALFLARRYLISRPDFSHPSHWAAFVLFGQ